MVLVVRVLGLVLNYLVLTTVLANVKLAILAPIDNVKVRDS